jgi:hypothetical protein
MSPPQHEQASDPNLSVPFLLLGFHWGVHPIVKYSQGVYSFAVQNGIGYPTLFDDSCITILTGVYGAALSAEGPPSNLPDGFRLVITYNTIFLFKTLKQKILSETQKYSSLLRMYCTVHMLFVKGDILCKFSTETLPALTNKSQIC